MTVFLEDRVKRFRELKQGQEQGSGIRILKPWETQRLGKINGNQNLGIRNG